MHTRPLIFLLLLSAATALAQGGASPNEQARFLAGLPVNSAALDSFTHNSAWTEHASQLEAAWSKTEQRQLLNAREWARLSVPGSQRGGTMFYMFSGPDFLYANAFFPHANTYILCGTEPVGSVDLSKLNTARLADTLMMLRGSMSTILRFHYFITKEMRADLNRAELGGTLPILYVFLARTGHTIQEVSYVNTPAPGVRIVFGGGMGKTQTLYYFKTDLSNGGGSAKFLKWCAGQGPGMSLLKAASYLPHSDSFSGVRNFLLEDSRVIVQDDSGIPFRYFDQKRWTLRLFGNFQQPIELFAKNHQPDLAQAYASSHAAPLGFAFGYHYEKSNGMAMVAVRK
jgi:hypothetical protein